MGPESPSHHSSPDTPPQDPSVFIRWPWRTGRSVGRTIYAHPVGAEDGDIAYDGFLIGLFDTSELAAAAVRAHNLTIGHTPQQS